jgi:hypothetical protein
VEPGVTQDGRASDLDLSSVPLGGAELRAVASLWKRDGRELVARFTGSSMLPTVTPGTELRVRCGEEAAVGDVVAWVDGACLVVHRVVGAGPGWLLTCGDAACLPDPPVTRPTDLVGRIVERRDGDAWTALPPAPRSRCRALVVGLCVLALRSGPRLGLAVVVSLLSARRWFYYAPRAVAARLLRRFRARPISD